MAVVGQICKKGIWDESIPGISFDEEGVSNYAKLHKTLIEEFPRGEKGLHDWEMLIKRIKKAGRGNKYDCIIGVSGGTDSSYLLYVSKNYGLKPLAVNLDNGWSSDIAVKNIRKITTALEIDLFTYVIEYEEIKRLLRSYMKASLPWIDIPTDLAIKAALYKVASKEKIRYVLRGNDFRSEGSQPREWTYGDGKQLKYVFNKFGEGNLKTFPNYTLSSMVYYALIKQIKSIYPFYYLEYDKSKARQFLTKEYGWEYYGGHHHENIFTKFVISYWLFQKFGIDKRKITLSAQVLSGQLKREEAIKIINEIPFDADKIQRDIEYVLKKLDFTFSDFDEIMKSPNKSYLDYPYYKLLINNLSFISKFFLKLVFLHKPQSVFQAEMRNK